MKKLNNKGYSLTELLAIMSILLILLGAAIGAYTKIIVDSSKQLFVAEAVSQMEGIKILIESEGIDVEDSDTVYYFDYRLAVDKSESPFEEWDDCYVVVTYDDYSEKNTYYWTALDADGWGVRLGKEISILTKEDVVHNKFDNVIIGASIGGRSKAEIYSITDLHTKDYRVIKRAAS